MNSPEILRLTAFTETSAGGNPAGVVIGTDWPEPADMQRIAADIGYSETAFLAGDGGTTWQVRYYSPQAEVPFCGHATIASAVALAERYPADAFEFVTRVGAIPLAVIRGDGPTRSALISVEPCIEDIDPELRGALLDCFGWTDDDLDPLLPMKMAFAGARHPIVALRSRHLLASMSYDFESLRKLMLKNDYTTVQVIWREAPTTFWARDPFPVGGVVEDPATGAAAAALGGYLRALRLVATPAVLTIHQGDDLGRPSLITVSIGDTGGIEVAGPAVPITDAD